MLDCPRTPEENFPHLKDYSFAPHYVSDLPGYDGLRGHYLDEGDADADALQDEVFAVGNAHAFDPLRDWFKAIYEVLLGASQGPRFGGFIALYGVQETITLIDNGLSGKLVTATDTE